MKTPLKGEYRNTGRTWFKSKHGLPPLKEIGNTEYRKQLRHLSGISKKYSHELGISKTVNYKRFKRKRYKALKKGGGKLLISTIQLVYEDNIKKYCTLTCYLCLMPIEFGKDHLEHKVPLSRGGTNEYNNLAIACQKCNLSKGKKTYKEYKGGLK